MKASRIVVPLLMGVAAGAGCVPTVSPEKVAELKALEAESAARLLAEGEILYYTDSVRLSGPDFKGGDGATAILDAGELRRGIREASKALFLGQTTGAHDVLAFAKRDLAYAYSLAGHLDRAARFAEEATDHAQRAPPAFQQTNRKRVLGPTHKIRGDVNARRRGRGGGAGKRSGSSGRPSIRRAVPTRLTIASGRWRAWPAPGGSWGTEPARSRPTRRPSRPPSRYAPGFGARNSRRASSETSSGSSTTPSSSSSSMAGERRPSRSASGAAPGPCWICSGDASRRALGRRRSPIPSGSRSPRPSSRPPSPRGSSWSRITSCRSERTRGSSPPP